MPLYAVSRALITHDGADTAHVASQVAFYRANTPEAAVEALTASGLPEGFEGYVPLVPYAVEVPEQSTALHSHFERMQEMAARYLEPRPYEDRSNCIFNYPENRDRAFVEDMIYMLDGPEQRAAQYGEPE